METSLFPELYSRRYFRYDSPDSNDDSNDNDDNYYNHDGNDNNDDDDDDDDDDNNYDSANDDSCDQTTICQAMHFSRARNNSKSPVNDQVKT